MLKLLFILLGCLLGALITGWSLYMIVIRLGMTPEQRRAARPGWGVIIVFLLIGLADSAKAGKDLIAYIRASGQPSETSAERSEKR